MLFYPTPQGQTVRAVTAVTGSGVLCTPRGERIGLQVSGGAKGNVWRHMDGHEFHLTAAHPAKTDYLFYVNNPKSCNELTFTKTEAEFEEAVAKYEKAREANGGNEPSTCK